ncbi:hypothetical protein DB44_CO00230 [Candidatus Protochlamydia amoebophila]|uniref:Transposase DDE domain-containing protein n=1 Tax=Candidatus Protochlamydia amoebophila TaxID=362787 RepID=A0A0C1HBI9_9BACT|nr:hypothetical protein DB44_CO00230 [Candidatus Protochlamydia amoebophila]
MAFQLNFGNVANVSAAQTLPKGIFGKLFDDEGVISKALSKGLF